MMQASKTFHRSGDEWTVGRWAQTVVMVGLILSLVVMQMVIVVYAVQARPVRSDCIIILGCKVSGYRASPFLYERANEGLRLYRQGYAPFIIVSGGKGRGEDISEARWLKEYLVANGVDPTVIITEDRSRSTRQNIEYSARYMANWGFDSAVIVSNKFHLKRASYIAEHAGIDVSCSGFEITRDDYWPAEIYGYMREVPGMAAVLAGAR